MARIKREGFQLVFQAFIVDNHTACVLNESDFKISLKGYNVHETKRCLWKRQLETGTAKLISYLYRAFFIILNND